MDVFELRYKVETWEEYRDGISTSVKHIEKPVLQYREKNVHVDSSTATPAEPAWSEWVDVPTVVVEA